MSIPAEMITVEMRSLFLQLALCFLLTENTADYWTFTGSLKQRQVEATWIALKHPILATQTQVISIFYYIRVCTAYTCIRTLQIKLLYLFIWLNWIKDGKIINALFLATGGEFQTLESPGLGV